MKVWVVYHIDYGSIELYTEDSNILETPTVKRELGYFLDGDIAALLDEHDEFINSIDYIKNRGGGTAYIEERINVSLEEVGEMK